MNKTMTKDFFKNNWFRLALIAVLLLFCAVYAVNTRYYGRNGYQVFDKWQREWINANE